MASTVRVVNDVMELKAAQRDGHRTRFPPVCFCELHDMTVVIVHSALQLLFRLSHLCQENIPLGHSFRRDDLFEACSSTCLGRSDQGTRRPTGRFHGRHRLFVRVAHTVVFADSEDQSPRKVVLRGRRTPVLAGLENFATMFCEIHL